MISDKKPLWGLPPLEPSIYDGSRRTGNYSSLSGGASSFILPKHKFNNRFIKFIVILSLVVTDTPLEVYLINKRTSPKK